MLTLGANWDISETKLLDGTIEEFSGLDLSESADDEDLSAHQSIIPQAAPDTSDNESQSESDSTAPPSPAMPPRRTLQKAQVQPEPQAPSDSSDNESQSDSTAPPSPAMPSKTRRTLQKAQVQPEPKPKNQVPQRPHAPSFKFPEKAIMATASEMRLKKFNIDLFSTPGRTRVWSRFDGQYVWNLSWAIIAH